MFDLLSIAVVMVVSALAQIAGHYFDWKALLGKPLPQLGAYVYGTTMIVLPLTAYYLAVGERQAALALTGAVASAGLAVFGCYMLDGYLLALRKLRDLEQREKALRASLRSNDERAA